MQGTRSAGDQVDADLVPAILQGKPLRMGEGPMDSQSVTECVPVRLNLPPDRERLVSLDVLRGITVALMILVNNAGDGSVSYAQLRHSTWNGCTLTDLVFPNFLFIVGASIVLAFRRRRERGISRRTILLQVLGRALIIFTLGLILNALPAFHLADLRYYGVLQRIALCYLAASIVYLAGGLWASMAACASSIVGYWWLMTRVPMPEFGLPGVGVPLLDRTGNLASLLDRMLVPPAHLYHHGVYDPEGLLSTLPALGTTLLGVLAISWLAAPYSVQNKVKMLVIAGLLFVVGGLLWAHSFPLNKRLWTSSFVLFTGGISMALLASLYCLIDRPAGVRRGLVPWLALGRNALTAYVFSEVLAIALSAIQLPRGGNLQQYLFRLLPHWLGPPPLVSLVYSILFVIVCTLPVLELLRRRIFLKI
jgi:predicted acyltransferase